jgi:malic enzyme
MRVLRKPPQAIAEQRVVCVGAGSAGMGVVRMIAKGTPRLGGCGENFSHCPCLVTALVHTTTELSCQETKCDTVISTLNQ